MDVNARFYHFTILLLYCVIATSEQLHLLTETNRCVISALSLHSFACLCFFSCKIQELLVQHGTVDAKFQKRYKTTQINCERISLLVQLLFLAWFFRFLTCKHIFSKWNCKYTNYTAVISKSSNTELRFSLRRCACFCIIFWKYLIVVLSKMVILLFCFVWKVFRRVMSRKSIVSILEMNVTAITVLEWNRCNLNDLNIHFYLIQYLYFDKNHHFHLSGI